MHGPWKTPDPEPEPERQRTPFDSLPDYAPQERETFSGEIAQPTTTTYAPSDDGGRLADRIRGRRR